MKGAKPLGASQVALVVKNLPANAGDARDMGLIPGSRKPLGGVNGNPLQYSCLENPMDRGAWWATVHGGRKELDKTEGLSTNITSAQGNANQNYVVFTSYLSEWLSPKRTQVTHVGWRGCGGKGTFITDCGNVNWYTVENSMEGSQNQNRNSTPGYIS